jgi:hypothetical protein
MSDEKLMMLKATNTKL